MAEIISRYSETRNLETPQTPQEALQQAVSGDSISPYSFQDWVERNVGIIPGKERRQYDQYLQQWYQTRASEQNTIQNQLRNDYIALLRQLTLVFQDEAQQLSVENIDFTDPKEVEQAIPFYAKKLKEIAINIINKREAIQRAKLKYNLAGATDALERLFYEYILKAFTKRSFPGNQQLTTVLDATALNAIPELSAVGSTFQFNIEEIYDSTNYFDRSPFVPTSAYFDLSGSSVVDYLTGQGVEPQYFEWLYNTGVSHLCADNPLLWVVDDVLAQYQNGVPLSALETYDSVLLNDYNRIELTKKYIGENQYIISGGYFIPKEFDLITDIGLGNNFFYWLSGEHADVNDTTVSVDTIRLSATNLIDDGATGHTQYLSADLIFTERGNSLSGAWLQSTDSITLTPIMSARLRNGRYLFNFPFPGFGLAGEDLDWTGRSFDNNDLTFDFLDQKTKQEIQTLYWSTSTNAISSLTPISLYDTSLVESGAYPARIFNESDQIIIRSEPRDESRDGIYKGTQEYAWLYKMENSDIYVQNGDTNIHWPLYSYDTTLSVYAPSAQCSPIPLSTLNVSNTMLGAVAATNPNYADRIYKISSQNGQTITNAAWLSGKTIHCTVTGTSQVSGASQPGISLRILPGDTGTFVWEDSTTTASSIFPGYYHQVDCPYLKQPQFSLFKERPTQNKRSIVYNQWDKCECKTVHYSPFGHPGSTFDEYNGMADFIIAINEPVRNFQLEDWTDIYGQNYKNSDQFGWFKLSNSPEPDCGWGPGEWVTYNGDAFKLSANYMYLYYRSDLQRGNSVDSPFGILRHRFSNNNQQWIKLRYNRLFDRWDSLDIPTDIVLQSGDFLRYNHFGTNTITFSSNRVTARDRTVFQTPDYTSVGGNINFTTSGFGSDTFLLSSIDYNVGATFTNIEVSDLTQIPVTIPTYTEGDNIAVSAQFSGTDSFTLTSTTSSVSTTTVYLFNFTSDQSNFMINVPLSGWNYSTNSYDGSSAGARPFWAIAYDTPTQQTKFKGINIWGGNAIVLDDGYTFKSQPEFSEIILEGDTYLEYVRKGSTQFTWKQPLVYTVDSNEKRWNRLSLDTSQYSNLSSLLLNDARQLIVSATYIPSDIELDIIEGEPLGINYYARNTFTWTQSLSDTSLGIPPTGGVWVPIISGDLIQASNPYAYLTNRHFPTYASAPFVGNLFTTRDKGGFFIPSMLGVSTFLSRGRTVMLDTLNNITITPENRGLEATYQNSDLYTTDQGLTQTDQLVPVSTLKVDSSWIKDSIAEHARAGMINAARLHQEFAPYQTKYETTKYNEYGLRRQGDLFDPWFGEFDNEWENDTDFPPNFREQHNILEWYEQFNTTDREIYKWKTDIFGNQYCLIKDLDNKSVYEKRKTEGEIWTRDARNIVTPASASLASVYDKFTLNTAPLLSTNIYDIDVWYDVMMFWTPKVVLFAKLSFNFDTNTIFTIADNIHKLWLCDHWFAGTWFFEQDKIVTVGTIGSALSSGPYFYPTLYQYNLETNDFTRVFNASSDSQCFALSSLQLSSIEDPIFTYNTITQMYNLAFIGNSSNFSGMYFVMIDVKQSGEEFQIQRVKATIPIA